MSCALPGSKLPASSSSDELSSELEDRSLSEPASPPARLARSSCGAKRDTSRSSTVRGLFHEIGRAEASGGFINRDMADAVVQTEAPRARMTV